MSAVFSAISLLVDKPVDNRLQSILHQRENVIGAIVWKTIELSALKSAGGVYRGYYLLRHRGYGGYTAVALIGGVSPNRYTSGAFRPLLILRREKYPISRFWKINL
jgi:hypothetical protein